MNILFGIDYPYPLSALQQPLNFSILQSSVYIVHSFNFLNISILQPHRFISGLVWVPRSTMSLSLMPSRYRCVIMILTCPIKRDTLYRSKPFFSCIWAKVWRQVCGLTRTEGDTPTSFAACFSIRATASSVKGFPFLLRNRFLWRLGYSFKWHPVGYDTSSAAWTAQATLAPRVPCCPCHA